MKLGTIEIDSEEVKVHLIQFRYKINSFLLISMTLQKNLERFYQVLVILLQ